ncbi:hypothetical protein FQR65_LT11085 [Abscondita terminalis]|nr:hypothetical protein FQR65_LT11085 [Abscondita terminalis]
MAEEQSQYTRVIPSDNAQITRPHAHYPTQRVCAGRVLIGQHPFKRASAQQERSLTGVTSPGKVKNGRDLTQFKHTRDRRVSPSHSGQYDGVTSPVGIGVFHPTPNKTQSTHAHDGPANPQGAAISTPRAEGLPAPFPGATSDSTASADTTETSTAQVPAVSDEDEPEPTKAPYGGPLPS